MTFPEYFYNVRGEKGAAALRVYRKPSVEEGMRAVCEDMPINREQIAKLIRDLAEHL